MPAFAGRVVHLGVLASVNSLALTPVGRNGQIGIMRRLSAMSKSGERSRLQGQKLKKRIERMN